MEARNLDHIKKYIPDNNGDLERTVIFIKNLPDIAYYIKLEVDFYLNKSVLEQKISEKYDFNEIFNKIISPKDI